MMPCWTPGKAENELLDLISELVKCEHQNQRRTSEID